MHNWCLEVWGDYACFTRPEMKVERVSYDVMTPAAARAIFEAILWKPAMRWNVTKIEVLNPIKWISVRRNEVDFIASSNGGFYVDEVGNDGKPKYRQQRAGLFLRDVRYRIHGYFDFIPPVQRKTNHSSSSDFWADELEEHEVIRLDEAEAKYAAMFERRVKKGQCFHRPYLGCREFACDFRLVDLRAQLADPINETRDLGFMLYDMDFTEDVNNPTAQFFRARLHNGTVITDRREVEVRG